MQWFSDCFVKSGRLGDLTLQRRARKSRPMPLRLATVDDIDAMHAVRLAVRQNVLSDETLVRPEHYRKMLEEFGRGWVYEESREVVAFGIADHTHRNIWALFVAQGFERRGIGSRLLKIMVTWLFEQSQEPVWLTTGRNTRAELFYRAAGWRVVGSATDAEIRFELSFGDSPRSTCSPLTS